MGRRGEEEGELRAVLGHPQHQKALFDRPVKVEEGDVARMWAGVQAGGETLAYVLLVEEDILMRGRERFASLDELRHEVQRRHAAMRVERRHEMERLYESLHQPMRRVMKRGTVVSMEECGRLVMAGREDLRAERPCQTLRVIADMEAEHEQCTGVDHLIRRVAERRKAITVALGEKPLLPPAPTLPSRTPTGGKPSSAVPPPVSAVSAQDRDALFEWLAGEECALFSSNVKLNNRALDALVEAGGGLEGTLDAAKALNGGEAQQQYSTVEVLKTAIADWVKERQRTRSAASLGAAVGALTLPTTAAATPRPPATPLLPALEAPNAASAAPAVVVSSIPTSEADLTAPPPAVGAFPLAIADLESASLSAPTESTTESEVTTSPPAPAIVVDPPPAAAAVAVPSLPLDAAITTPPPPVARPPPPPSAAAPATLPNASGPPPPRPIKISGADRDAVFNVLAEDTALFIQDVKLTNKALDSIITAGGGRVQTIDHLKSMFVQHLRFTTIPALLVALLKRNKGGADSQEREERSALYAWMTGGECELFSVEVRLGDADLDALLREGKGLASALALLRRVQAHPLQFASVTPLLQCLAHLTALPSLPSPPSLPFPAPERDALFDYLASDSCNVFTSNVKLSNKTLDRLLCAGNGLQPTLTILRLLNLRAEQVATVPQLVAVISGEYAAAYDALVDLTLFFTSPASSLPLPPPSPEALLQFYWDAETGHDLIHHLRSLLPPTPLPDLASLLPLVSASRVTELMEMNGQVAGLHAELGLVLGGKKGGGGVGVGGGGKGGMRGVLREVEGLTVGECWKLAKAGKVGLEPGKAAVYVSELLSAKRTFSSVTDLIEAVRMRTEEEHRTEVKTVVQPKRS